MTKAAQIMALYDGTRTTSEIAAIVGCHKSYVRTVARQRRGASSSVYDIAYRKKADNEYVKAERRAAYRKARSSGASPAEASRICSIEHTRAIARSVRMNKQAT